MTLNIVFFISGFILGAIGVVAIIDMLAEEATNYSVLGE